MKSKLLTAIMATLIFVACKKNDTVVNSETPQTDVAKAYKDIATVIITTAKNDNNFRQTAYVECNKQKYGDYYVKLDELIALNSTQNYWDAATANKLTELQRQIKSAKRNDVIVFIPSLEKHPEKANASRVSARTEVYEEAVAVIGDEYQVPTQTCPGYIVETNGTLGFYQTINEAFAWEHDVWVIGEEEICSPENMVAAVEDTATLNYGRVNGGAEWGGIVKVTDWSVVEPWVAGKVEFRLIVYKGAGTPANAITDRKFGKWKRSNFNNQFKDFGHFIGNWNLSTIGDWTTEKWIEEDGNFSITLTFGVSFKPDSTPLAPTLTANVSIPIKNLDDDLGLSLIQFTDPISTIYYQSGIEIKRRN
jgi:hypothetical protein